MQIKRFHGENIHEALKLVKAEFGGNAVILSTKGIKGRGVEVTAAADRDSGAEFNVGVYGGRLLQRKEEGRAGSDNLSRSPVNYKINEVVPFTPPVYKASTPARHEGLSIDGAPVKELSAEADPDFRREFKELKELVGTLVSHVQKSEFFGSNRNLSNIQKGLVAAGVDETLSYKILEFLSKKLSSKDIADPALLRMRLKQFIMKQVSVSRIEDSGHKPKVIVFVGPTGVGKTTTIAKIAAMNSINRNKKVALVTLDTYRIAAVEQLRVYATIMGLPLHVASTPESLSRLLAGIRGVDMILVDTAGRSQKAIAHMEELRRMYRFGGSLETHLVISATAKEKDCISVLKSYKDLPIDRLIFTKLDETDSYGGLFNVLMVAKKPVSFLTVGQKVPEDIEEATPERIADLVLSNQLIK